LCEYQRDDGGAWSGVNRWQSLSFCFYSVSASLTAAPALVVSGIARLVILLRYNVCLRVTFLARLQVHCRMYILILLFLDRSDDDGAHFTTYSGVGVKDRMLLLFWY